jgi:PAS domain S-box-containing protein
MKVDLSANKVEIEKLKLIYGALLSSQIGMILSAGILTTLLRDVIPTRNIILWLLALFVTITYRLTLWHAFKSINPDKKFNIRKWERKFLFGVFLSALVWGTAGIVLYAHDSILHQTFLELTIAGIVSVSIGTLSPNIKALLIFMPITTIPMALNAIASGNMMSLPLIGMILIFLFISIGSGKRFNRHIKENLRLRYEAYTRELKLQESEEKYRLLYEKSEDPMLIITGNHFAMANQAAIQLLGYDSQQHLLHTPTFNNAPTYQLDGSSSKAKARKIMKKVHRIGYLRFEWLYKKLDGNEHPADVTLTSIPFEGKKAAFCIVRDISTNKEIEHNLIIAQKKAESANKAKSAFLANMSHEIRTPMNGVIAATDLLLRHSLDKQQKQRALIIKQSSESMLTIINDILDFSKIEAGKLEIQLRDFDIVEMLDEFSSSISSRIKSKGLKFNYTNSSNTHHWYKGDSGRIRQILNNLIDNSIKFTPQGSISLSYSIIEDSLDMSLIRFAVTDTGIGINSKLQKQIFTRFTQGDNSNTRRYGGTGLGLSICKQLSLLMGGDIGFESDTSLGTEFWFTIKLIKVSSSKYSIKDYSNAIQSLKKIKAEVLIVDDNNINQTVTRNILELFDITVTEATNGRLAIKLLQQQKFDLVFMDCQMPVMDGYKATKIIRNTQSAVMDHTIPIIAMTASAMRGDREKCLASGMDDYLAKPINSEKVLKKLQHWLLKDKTESVNAEYNDDRRQEITQETQRPPPVFDYHALYDRLNGNHQLIETISTKFIISMDKHIKELNLVVDNKDLEKIKTTAHKLKGSAATIGCQHLSTLASNIEVAAKNNDLFTICQIIPYMQPSFDRSIEELKKKIAINI